MELDRDKTVLDRPPKIVQPIESRRSFLHGFVFYRLRRLGEIRDGILVLLLGWYALGYVFWSLYALIYRAGFPPPFELQYLITGIPLSFVLVVLVVLHDELQRFAQRWPKWMGADAAGWRQRVRRALLVVSNVYIIAFPVAVVWWLVVHRGRTIRPIGAGLIVVFVVLMLLRPPTGGRTGAFFSSVSRLGFEGVLPPLLVSAGILAGMAGMMVLPQELGGALPRCARLDIDATRLSRETYRELVPTNAPARNGPIVRTIQLQILFAAGDLLLVRARGEVIELRQSAVRAIHICPRWAEWPRREEEDWAT
jgi:hypothetical protein